jgi:hypothetical protein
VLQAPAREAFQVLDWMMSRHVHEYFDASGRPLGEGRAAAFQQVETEMQLCPYGGSRYQHAKPMNVTALRQMPPWQHLLTMLSWLSQRHRFRHQTAITTYDDLAQVTSAGIFLADFLVLRRQRPLPSREIPVLISGLYKLCLGFQLAYLPERYANDPTVSHLPDPAVFYAYLEENELLIGEAEVCSGSPAMLTQAYEAITKGHTIRQEALPAPCASLEIDWEQFDIFTDSAARVWHDLVLFVLRAPGFVPQLSDVRLPPELRDQLNICLQQHGAELLAGQTGMVVDIARAVRLYSDRPAAAWRPQSVVPPPSQPSSLALAVLRWLDGVVGEEMKSFAPVVASDLEAQLASYEVYETAVLADLNRHLGALMQALGHAGAGAALTSSVLSRTCGRTPRDWAATSR